MRIRAASLVKMVSGLLVICSIISYWLFATHAGTQWGFLCAQKSISGFEVERIEGSVLNKLHVTGVKVSAPDFRLHLDQLDSDIDPSTLLKGILHIRSLKLQGIAFTRLKDTKKTTSHQWLPIKLVFDEIDLQNAQIQSNTADDPWFINRLFGSLQVSKSEVVIPSLELNMPSFASILKGHLNLNNLGAIDFIWKWRWQSPNQTSVEGEARAVGNLNELVLTHFLKSPSAAELTAVIHKPLDQLSWQATLDLDSLDPSSFSSYWPSGKVAFHIEGNGSGTNVHLEGLSHFKTPKNRLLEGAFNIDYLHPGQWVIQELSLKDPKTAAALNLEGKTYWQGNDSSMDLLAHWSQLQWPLNEAPKWQSSKGQMSIKGLMSDFQLEGRGIVNDSPIDLNGQFSLKDKELFIHLLELKGDGLDAVVEGSYGTSVNLGWRIRSDQLAKWLPNSKGMVETHGQIQGEVGHRKTTLSLAAKDFSFLDVVAKTFKLETQINSGPEPSEIQVESSGFRYNTTNIDRLSIRFLGVLSESDDQIKVKMDQPIHAKLSASNIGFKNTKLLGLESELEMEGSLDSPLRFSLKAPGIHINGGYMDFLASATGTRRAHQVSVLLTGHINRKTADHPRVLDVLAKGRLEGNTWLGQITKIKANLMADEPWTTHQESTLKIGEGHIDLARLCLEKKAATLCLKVNVMPNGDIQLDSQIRKLVLSELQMFTPTSHVIEGEMNLDTSFKIRNSLVDEGTLDLNVIGAKLKQKVFNSRKELDLGPMSIQALIQRKGGQFTILADQNDFAPLRATFVLDAPIDLSHPGSLPLRGDARIAIPDLSKLSPWVNDAVSLEGQGDLVLRLLGTVKRPNIEVDSNLSNGFMSVPKLGIEVKNVFAQLHSVNENDITLSAKGRSGGGEIHLDGKASLNQEGHPGLSIAIQGNRFLAMNTQDVKILISPELTLESHDNVNVLKGDINVPEALLHVEDQTKKIKPSRDVVILNQDHATERVSGFPVEAHVNLSIGDKVKLTGPNYDADVSGHLNISQLPDQKAFGTGEIRLDHGHYSLYGVTLDVDGGRIYYANTLIDNPNLDVQATRKSDDVLVGAKVLGTLSQPSVSLFSNKPMSQTDMMRYLVMGSASDGLSQTETPKLMSAASGVGGAAGGLVAKELAKSLGLGGFVDISVKNSLSSGGVSQGFGAGTTWDSAQSTALFLGKYLTPKLYAQYGMGLVQNNYVFRLRYDLTQRWKLQTETGQYSSGDLLFQWEH